MKRVFSGGSACGLARTGGAALVDKADALRAFALHVAWLTKLVLTKSIVIRVVWCLHTVQRNFTKNR